MISGHPTVTNETPFNITVTFLEPVAYANLARLDGGTLVTEFAVTNGSAMFLNPPALGTFATEYTVQITPNGNGDVTINVGGAGLARDAAGNTISAGQPVTVAFDDTPPQPMISGHPTVTNETPFNITVTFLEPVAYANLARLDGGTLVTEFAVTNGSAMFLNPPALGTFATEYTVQITPNGNGDVTINVGGAGLARDAAGNTISAGQPVTVAFVDNLTVTATSPVAADGVAASMVTVTLLDAQGNALGASGGTVVVAASGSAVASSVTDHGDGSYSATLTSTVAETVTVSATLDGTALTDTAQVVFTNVAPTAAAGADQRVASGAAVTLDGSASDPGNAGQSLTYAWTQTSGPNVVLSDARVAQPTFTAPTLLPGDADRVLEFALTVNDGLIDSAADTVTITVTAPANSAPTAAAGADQRVASGAAVTLDGSASDPGNAGQSLTYAWTQTSGPNVVLSDARVAQPTFTAPTLLPGAADRVLEFALTVNDGLIDSAADTVTITVTAPANSAPTAAAGADQRVASGAAVTLDGSASDPGNAGQSLTYAWTQTSGPNVVLSDARVAQPTFTAPTLLPGDADRVLEFALTVNDGLIDSAADTVTITVTAPANSAPTAAAGADQRVASGAAVTLDGSASDPGNAGQSLTYAWTQTSGPNVVLSDARVAQPTFTAPTLLPGDADRVLEFALTVNDGLIDSAADTVTITVTAPANSAPTAAAGADQRVASGAAVTLDGSASDPGNAGQSLTYAWTQTSGPNVVLSDARVAQPGFTAPVLLPGDADLVLEFALTVNDGLIDSAADAVTITVTAPANSAPTAAAGADQRVASGAAVTLDGSASDPGNAGQSLTYAWTQTSGPNVVLSDASVAQPGFTAPVLLPGDADLVLEFALTVNDGLIDSAADAVTITVTAPANSAPTAAAGADQRVAAGAAVTLDGSASDPGNAGQSLTYAWTQTSGPNVVLSDASVAQPTFTAPTLLPGDADRVLEFALTVNDGLIDSAADTVTITVTAPANSAPTAAAGADQRVASGAAVTLDGSASDPGNAGQSLTYAWTQTSGPNVVLSDARVAQPTFTAPVLLPGDADRVLEFALTVNDGLIDSAADTVTITVTAPANSAPTAAAGADQRVASGAAVTLDGSASDPGNAGQSLTYAWTQTSGPNVVLSDARVAQPGFTAPTLLPGDADRVLEFALTVNDGLIDSAADAVTITVTAPANSAPTAAAGADQRVASGAAVTLDGSASDPGNAGQSLTYAWTQTSGPNVVLSDARVAQPTFTAPTLLPGDADRVLEFALTVNDGLIDSAADAVTITVTAPANSAPTAAAGADQRVASGAAVTLDGSASDPGNAGQSLTYAWTQTSGPNVVLSDARVAQPTFTAPTLLPGAADRVLEFALTVNDGLIDSAADTVTITVTAPANSAPTAAAGADQRVASGAAVTLDGSASDPGNAGQSLTYAWTQTSGPNVVLSDARVAQPTFTAPTLLPGDADRVLEFALTVNDGLIDSAADTVTITVTAPANSAPTAAAGADQRVASGAAVTLDGSASDPGNAGQSLTYAWTQTSGPNVVLSDARVAQPTFTAPTLLPGAADRVLEFALTVNDGLIDSAADTVTITVTAPANSAPTAAAGADQRVASGAAVTLDGSASDPGNAGQSLTYAWTQTSGPNVVLSDASVAQPTFTAPTLLPGDADRVLEFALTVNDGLIDSAADTVTITVTAPANSAPTAAAGADQRVASGAAVTLDGSASDPGNAGQSLTYAWTQTSGPNVVLSDARVAQPTFTAPTLLPGDADRVLEFALTVNDGLIDSAADTVTITVTAPANSAPTAAAGADQRVASGAAVSLDGSASDPGNAGQSLTYAWTQTSGPNVVLSDARVAQPGFTAPVLLPGDADRVLEFALTVNDGLIDSAADTVTITVTAPANSAPTAAAGADQRLASGAAVTLDGSASDPGNAGQSLTYAWTQTSGPNVVLSDARVAQPTFTAPVLLPGDADRVLEFALTVNDGLIDSAADTVTITVTAPANSAPTAAAGADQRVASGAAVTLDGSASDPGNAGQSLTYAWTQTSGPNVVLSDARVAQPGFTAPTLLPGDADRVLEFALTVNDGLIDSAADAVTITVTAPANSAPTAAAGADQRVASGAAVTLDGSASDPGNAGQSLTYAWTQTSGPNVVLSDARVAQPTFTAPTLLPGAADRVLEFALTVNDGLIDSAADTVTITVTAPANSAPTAAAGADQRVASGAAVTLDGSASDPGNAGQSLTYAWTQTSGPNVVLSDARVAQPGFTAPTLLPGDADRVLEFALTVNDGLIDSAADAVTITVTAPANSAPTAAAGADQRVASGAAVTLDGSASDPGNAGQSLTYAWTQTSGPNVVLSDASVAQPGFTAPTLLPGDADLVLEFALTVNDGLIDSAADTVTITVTAPANSAPTAAAGADQRVASGAAVTLDGSASDPGNAGQSLTYAWTQTSGPNVVLSDARVAQPGFTAPTLLPGDADRVLEFALTVNDGLIDSAADTVTITVTAPANSAPTAAAGADQRVASGAAVTLDGSASDPGNAGQSLTYAWTQTSGPNVVLSDASVAQPGFTAPTLLPGDADLVLEFALTVNDGLIDSAADTVTITVTAPANSAPTAAAGADQRVASGAAVTLDGSASDPGNAGQSLTYAWTQTSGPNVVLSDARVAQPTFTAPVLLPGDADRVLEFALTVNDGLIDSAADAVTITVTAPANSAPTAAAGADQRVASGAAVTLDGSASDPGNAGQSLTYAWTQTSGPNVVLSDARVAQPGFTAPVLLPGDADRVLEFALTVNDGLIDSAADTVTITVTAPAVPEPAVVASATITAQPARIVADGAATSTITVQLRDANNNDLTASGGTVRLATDLGALGAVRDNNDGTYTATLTSATTAGTATVSGTLDGAALTDTAQVVFTPGAVSVAGITLSEGAVRVAENGGSATYTVVLTSAPTGDVTVTPSSSDPGAATVSGALTFTAGNWDQPQTVTVTGVNDDIDNAGDARRATISHAVAGGGYDAVGAADVAVTVVDDDSAGVTISVPGVDAMEVPAVRVTAAGDGNTATYTIVLDTEPTGDVTVTPSSSDTGAATVSGPLTFTARNWNVAQPVTVTGVNAAIGNPGETRSDTIHHKVVGARYDATNERRATISHAVAGGGYSAVAVADVAVTVTDDEDAGTGVDAIAPTVAITGAPEITTGDAFDVVVTFSEPVTGFAAGDVTVSHGAAGNLRGTGAVYRVEITPDGGGDVTLDVAADVARDAAGNGNRAAAQVIVPYDGTGITRPVKNVTDPVFTSDGAATARENGRASGYSATANVAEGVLTGYALTGGADAALFEIDPTGGLVRFKDAPDFEAPGDANGDNVYSFTVTATATARDGSQSADAKQNVSVTVENVDEPGTGNVAIANATTPGAAPVEGDELRAETGAITDPDGIGTFTYEWRRNGTAIDGAAGATYATGAEDPGTAITVAVTHIDAADHARQIFVSDPLRIGDDDDDAGTGVDAIAPTVAITGAPEITTGDAFDVVVTFSEPVTGFAAGDVTVSHGAAGNLRGTGAVYRVEITPDGGGDVTLDVAADVARDAAGNGNRAAAQVTVTWNAGEPPAPPPDPCVGSAPLSVAVTDRPGTLGSRAPFDVTVRFSDAVTGFELSDVSVENGAAGNLRGTGAVYRVAITPDGGGDVRLNIEAGAAFDGCNGNRAAPQVIVPYIVPPDVVRLAVSPERVSEGAGPTRVRVTATIEGEGRFGADTDFIVTVGGDDDTATAGTDYRDVAAVRLTIPARRAGATTSVLLEPLDDRLEELEKTISVTARRANAASEDQSAIRIIAARITLVDDDDPAAEVIGPALVRFGRTVGEQSVEAITNRIDADLAPGFTGQIAGHSIQPCTPASPTSGTDSSGAGSGRGDRHCGAGLARQAAEPLHALLNAGRGSANDPHLMTPAGTVSGIRAAPNVTTPEARQAIAGTAFTLTSDMDSGGRLGLWGGGVLSGFEGTAGDVRLTGEVVGLQLGADWRRDGHLFGLMLSRSQGDITYRYTTDPGAEGRIEAGLTALVPYASLEITERLEGWAALGYGWGRMTFMPQDGPERRTPIRWQMGAAGLKGMLIEPEGDSGFGLDVVADVLYTRTASRARAATSMLPALGSTSGTTQRLRFGLEGRWKTSLATGETVTPHFGVALRHDDGDAETGWGLEIGGGFGFADPDRGLELEIAGRTLALHEDGNFRNWGLSLSLAWDPAPETKRGWSARLRHELGDPTSGGRDALLSPTAFPSLTETEDGTARWSLETAYGFTLGQGLVGSPHGALSGAGGSVDRARLGYRIEADAPHARDLDLDLWAEPGFRDGDDRAGLSFRLRW